MNSLRQESVTLYFCLLLLKCCFEYKVMFACESTCNPWSFFLLHQRNLIKAQITGPLLHVLVCLLILSFSSMERTETENVSAFLSQLST